jgi:hypothetical protein
VFVAPVSWGIGLRGAAMNNTGFVIAITVAVLCVAALLILLAVMKRQGRGEGRSRGGADRKGGTLLLVQPNPTDAEALPESEQAFLMEVLTGRSSVPIRYEEVPLTPHLRTTLQAVIMQAPNMAGTAGGALLLSDTYLLWFPPQVSRALADGTLSLMRSRAVPGGVRAIAVAANGKIVANATLLPAAAASAVGAGLLVWQVLAVVTAQKFLAEINARLARLETEIESIKKWLVNERLSKLEGDRDSLVKISRSLLEHDITDTEKGAFLSQLESIDRECSQICPAAKREMEEREAALKQLRLAGGDFHKNSVTAKKLVSEFDVAARTYLSGMFVQGLAAQVRSAMPVSRKVTLARLEQVGRECSAVKEQVSRFYESGTKRIPELVGTWTWHATNAEHQGQLRELLDSRIKPLPDMAAQLSQMADDAKKAIESDLEDGDRPLRFRVKLGPQGEVVSMQKINVQGPLPPPPGGVR